MSKLLVVAVIVAIIVITIAGGGGSNSNSGSGSTDPAQSTNWYMLGYYNDHDVGILAYYANQLGISYQSAWNVQANAYEFWIPTTADSGLLAKKFAENLDRR